MSSKCHGKLTQHNYLKTRLSHQGLYEPPLPNEKSISSFEVPYGTLHFIFVCALFRQWLYTCS
eukprot:scaffold473798_cov18-Prasinocladus_malaysianus.AAC.1